MSAVDVLSETELEVRDALPDDVHAITAIYAWHASRTRVI
jgi:phosphinothricin acetyltransferase